MTLKVSYENVKFVESDVIRETLYWSNTLWAENNWQPEWRFPKNAFAKWLAIFPKKILGSRISLN